MKMSFLKRLYKEKILILMTLPIIIHYILFNYIPMFGTIIAFKDFDYANGFFKSPWVGLKNFEFLFKTSDAFLITRNTLLYNVVFIGLGMFLAICMAIIFDLLGRSKLNKINQTLVLFPHFISWVVASYFVSSFLNVEKGMVNKILLQLGMDEVDWYSYKSVWPYILTISYIWKTIGYNSIIYYSSIKGFDTEYYEAAKIDGASWFQQIRYITFPMLKSIAIIMFIISIGSIFYSDFGLFYLVPKNSGVLYDVTSTIDTYVYNGMINGGNISMSAATGVYQSLVGFVLVVFTNTMVKKISPDNALF